MSEGQDRSERLNAALRTAEAAVSCLYHSILVLRGLDHFLEQARGELLRLRAELEALREGLIAGESPQEDGNSRRP